MSAHAAKLPVCPNCQTDLSAGENFCPTCGQPNHDVNVTFGHVVEEAVEGFFHFDSKVWSTFRELIFSPGKLTVDFLEGRRARFVPPVRLYVLLSIAFFFLLGKGADHEIFGGKPLVQIDTTAARKTPPTPAAATEKSSEPQSLPEALKAVRDSIEYARAHSGAPVKVTGDFRMLSLKSGDFSNKPLMEKIANGSDAFLDSLIRARGDEPTFWKRRAYRQSARLSTKKEVLQHQFVKNLSLGMFFLMPVFALLLKLFYRRQRPLYVQNLIFSINLHSFFFLFLSVLLLISLVLPASIKIPPIVPILAMWVYWVLALRRYSGQTYGRTLWKGSLLFTGYVGILMVVTLGVLAMSVVVF